MRKGSEDKSGYKWKSFRFWDILVLKDDFLNWKWVGYRKYSISWVDGMKFLKN